MQDKKLDEDTIETIDLLSDVQREISVFADLLLNFTDKGSAEIKNSTLFSIGEKLDECNLKLDKIHNRIIAA